MTPWDSQHAELMRPFLKHVTEERGLRALCTDILEYFATHVKPALCQLRHQVVHGDFNLGNVLVQDEDISGTLTPPNLITLSPAFPPSTNSKFIVIFPATHT